MNSNISDEYYMEIALELALKGEGAVNPNPLVGAVIVKNGEIVGRGFHKFYGGPHAEVYALKEAGEKAEGADMYVTLEPCSHYGKTPPCAEAIIKAGIKKVIIAVTDPNPLVGGRGIKLLEENGIKVITDVLREKSEKMNEVFMKYITKKEPFVVLKTAITLDGKIATKSGESKWITGELSRHKVHKFRNKYTGIMVGVGTVIKDDPLLDARLKEGGRSPKVIIVDSKLRVLLKARVFKTIDKREIIVACTEEFDKEKKAYLEDMGVKIIICPKNEENRVDLKYMTKQLGTMNIDGILLEGGGELNFSALKEGIVDKVISFIAPKIIGGKEAKSCVEGEGFEKLQETVNLKDLRVEKIGEDLMVEGYVNKN